jgi:hypothetical protein
MELHWTFFDEPNDTSYQCQKMISTFCQEKVAVCLGNLCLMPPKQCIAYAKFGYISQSTSVSPTI